MSRLQPKDVFRSDEFSKADTAAVIGASDPEMLRHRINAAILLLKSEKATRLLLCGDGRDKDPQGRSEAARMKQIAISSGIADSQVHLDEDSHDIIDMAKNIARLLTSSVDFKGTKSLVLVSSAWHLQRVHLVMKRHLPHQIMMSCCPTQEGYSATNWQMSPQGRATVENELRLIEKLLKTGYSLK